MSRLHDLAAEQERYAKADAEIERAFCRLIRRLHRAVSGLEAIGESDLGVLHFAFARRFHDATGALRALTNELTQSSYWPQEPGTY